MKKISYEEYVTHVDKRLKKFNRSLYWYTFKYAFIKRGMYPNGVFNLFRRYMHNDIFIKWDIEDEKD